MKDFVIGIGRTNIDLIYSGLEHLPQRGEEVFSRGFEIHLGGGAPGEAVILSKLGVPSKVVTWLGQDVFSDIARKEFGIGDPEIINMYHGTGIPVILSSAMICGGDRTFMSYREDIRLSGEDLQRIRREHLGARVVLLSPDYPEIYRDLDLSGAIRIFDTGWSDDLSLENPKFKAFLEMTDYYLPNRKEALKITGTSSVDEAAEVLSGYLKQVVIKLDSDGCLIRDENGTRIIPALTGINAVDPTGAGDAFLSGFVYGLWHGHGIENCVRLGCATGGTCVQAYGCLTRTLTEDELLEQAALPA